MNRSLALMFAIALTAMLSSCGEDSSADGMDSGASDAETGSSSGDGDGDSTGTGSGDGDVADGVDAMTGASILADSAVNPQDAMIDAMTGASIDAGN